MKKTRFFDKYQLILTLILVSCSLLLFACEDPYTPKFMPQYTPQPVPDGKGSVTLIVAGADARTISPDRDSVPIAAYTIKFLEHGTSEVLETYNRTVSNLSDPFYLIPGTFDIQVIAYIDEEGTKAVAQGEIEGIDIVEGTNTARTVTLNFFVTPLSTGTFRWEIEVPDDLSSASMIITPINTETGTQEETIPFTGTTPFTDSRNLKTGYYQITFELTKTGTQKIIFREFLHVFDNVESSFNKVFTEAHFNNIQYTVTFDFDNGTGNAEQTRSHGETATAPESVTKPTPAGLYLGTPPASCTFNGWYHGDTQWVFTDPVTGNMTLTAHWTVDGLVESVPANDLYAMANYIYTKTDAYTCLLDEDVSYSMGSLTDAKLTITGIKAVTINLSSVMNAGNNIALTIGKNITFSGVGALWILPTASSFTLSDNAVINRLYLEADNTGNPSVTIESGWTGTVASLNLYGADNDINNVIGLWYKTPPVTVLKGGGLSVATVAKFTLGNFYTNGSLNSQPITAANPPAASGGYKISTDGTDMGRLVAISYEARIVTGSNQGDYLTLTAALTAASNGTPDDPTEIVILRDITAVQNGTNNYAYSIPASKNIKLIVESGQSRTITASAGGFYLFIVRTNGSLSLEGNGAGILTLNGNNETAALYREGVYVDGASFTMNDGVTITGFNNSYNSGGVYLDVGTFKMNGGTISGNSASTGGGVYVGNSSTFTMSGGTIAGNSATGTGTNGNGGGVYVSNYTTFTMSGGTIYGLDAPAEFAPNTATNSGAALYTGSGKAKYDGAYGTGAIVTNNNTLPPQSPAAKFSGSGYSTLDEAITAAPAGTSVSSPTEIVILRDITANSGYTIPTNKNIKLNVESGQSRTITAAAGGFRLFTVSTNGSLTLEGNGAGILTLNGNNETAASNRQGVYVNGGTFIMNDGVTITGFKNTSSGGGVYVGSGGTFTMNGGTIAGNSATGTGTTGRGGGVYVTGGTFTMSGGTIYGTDAPSGFAPNTASGTAPNGAAAYIAGGTASYGGAYASSYGTAITTTNNTLPPLSGTAVITITFAQITDAAPNITGPTLSLTGTVYPKSATLTTGSGYTGISWEITGTGITGTGDSFTLNATDSRYNQIGDHHLTLIVYKGGVPYNKTIIFKIVS